MPNFFLNAGPSDCTAAASASAVAYSMCSVFGLAPESLEPPVPGVQAERLPMTRAPAATPVSSPRDPRARMLRNMVVSSGVDLADDEGTQGAVGDIEAGFDEVVATAPDRVFVLDGENTVESVFVEGVDNASPVHVAEPGHAVAPPAHVPRVRPGDGLARVAVTVAQLRERLDVLGLGVRYLAYVGFESGDGVDPHPHQVRGVVVQVEPEGEHPFPQLRRVGKVAGVAVRVPALHHAVLDHDLDLLFPGT